MMTFIEKIVVLQNPKGSIIRLYIDHDGKQVFSIQRSNDINGRTNHFFNKKLWYSRYHVNLILDRQIVQYEEKGYDVIEEFTLDPQPIALDQFRFDNHRILADKSMMKISHDAIPLSIDASFQHLSIIDMRYKEPVVNADVWNLFEQVRRLINFIPVRCTAIYEPSAQRFVLLSTQYRSQPKPTARYALEKLLKNTKTAITFCDFESQLVTAKTEGVFAHFDQHTLTFHYAGWRVANLIVERNKSSRNTYNLYSFKKGAHCLINTTELNIDHDQHALFLLNIVNKKVAQSVYVQRTERTKEISEMPDVQVASTKNNVMTDFVGFTSEFICI